MPADETGFCPEAAPAVLDLDGNSELSMGPIGPAVLVNVEIGIDMLDDPDKVVATDIEGRLIDIVTGQDMELIELIADEEPAMQIPYSG